MVCESNRFYDEHVITFGANASLANRSLAAHVQVLRNEFADNTRIYAAAADTQQLRRGTPGAAVCAPQRVCRVHQRDALHIRGLARRDEPGAAHIDIAQLETNATQVLQLNDSEQAWQYATMVSVADSAFIDSNNAFELKLQVLQLNESKRAWQFATAVSDSAFVVRRSRCSRATQSACPVAASRARATTRGAAVAA